MSILGGLALLLKGLRPGHIVIGGKELPTLLDVRHSLRFVGGSGSSRRRKPIRLIVIHDSVTFSTRSTFDVLRRRGLSTHFSVGPTGVVHQHLDPAKWTAWHAKGHNDVSIGIDITNPAAAKYLDSSKNRWWKKLSRLTLHGQPTVRLRPTDAQMRATSALIYQLTNALNLPLKAIGDGRLLGNVGSVSVASHAQLSSRKVDGHDVVEKMVSNSELTEPSFV